MQTEFEAKFKNINKDEMRTRLKKAGAELVRPEFSQKRIVFALPKGHELPDSYTWLRVRDEGGKITLSLKAIVGEGIESQKETQITVDDFGKASLILKTIGCVQKSFQESKRELWKLNGVEITIDEWPFLEPFIEIEGASERGIKDMAERLGFKWEDAVFGAVDLLVKEKYGVELDVINNHTPLIVFGGENPFVK